MQLVFILLQVPIMVIHKHFIYIYIYGSNDANTTNTVTGASCADASDIVKTAKEFFEFISATT